MAYRFKTDEPIEGEIKRIAREQIERAIDELSDDQLNRSEAIHQVRKRCKMVRGLLRLVRPAMHKAFPVENAMLRDAAGKLSEVRDADAILEAFDLFSKKIGDRATEKTLTSVRNGLQRDRESMRQELINLEARLADFASDMRAILERIPMWPCSRCGFAAVESGFLKTYRNGRRAMRAAYKVQSDQSFHQWRKWAKNHWHHVRLLRKGWKSGNEKRARLLLRLTDVLGHDHDLAALRKLLAESPEKYGQPTELRKLVEVLEQWRHKLQLKARKMGKRIYSDKPRNLQRQLRKQKRYE